MMEQVIIALGTNMGNRRKNLEDAAAMLDIPGVTIVDVSPIYETAPVGYAFQDDFLNRVLKIRTELDMFALLDLAHSVENELGRVRDPENRNGPRTIDVDLIYSDVTTMDTPQLSLPHPRAHQRAFVLAPWVDIEPDARLPQGRIADLLAHLDTSGIRRI